MKLTNYIREAYIRSVMNDVPKNNDPSEAAHKLVEDELDKEFQSTFPGISRKLAGESGWLNRPVVQLPFPLKSLCTYAKNYDHIKSLKVWRELEKLAEKQKIDNEKRQDLHAKLKGIVYGCTTRKALAEALPEFAKYLPKEQETSRALPVVANVVSEFVNAGWPKRETA